MSDETITCPICAEDNSPTTVKCENCGNDLSDKPAGNSKIDDLFAKEIQIFKIILALSAISIIAGLLFPWLDGNKHETGLLKETACCGDIVLLLYGYQVNFWLALAGGVMLLLAFIDFRAKKVIGGILAGFVIWLGASTAADYYQTFKAVAKPVGFGLWLNIYSAIVYFTVILLIPMKKRQDDLFDSAYKNLRKRQAKIILVLSAIVILIAGVLPWVDLATEGPFGIRTLIVGYELPHNLTILAGIVMVPLAFINWRTSKFIGAGFAVYTAGTGAFWAYKIYTEYPNWTNPIGYGVWMTIIASIIYLTVMVLELRPEKK